MTVMELPVSRKLAERLMLMMLVAFVLLSATYSVINPVFEAPDEVYHYPYIKHVADGRGLPVQDPEHPDLWEQEGSQPPLYYLAAALLTHWVDTDDIAEVRRLNPHATIGIPLARDNKNMVVHSDEPEWPWRGTVLALHLARLLSVALGSGTLWLVGRLALRLAPRRPSVAVVAMLLTGLNPMFLFISASANNDNMVSLLATATLLLLVSIVQQGVRSRRRVGLIGALVGLACLSKLSGLALVPLVGLGLLLSRLRETDSGRPDDTLLIERVLHARSHLDAWKRALLLWVLDLIWLLLSVVAIAGWWYLRNWTLYGDPTGLNIMLEIFGRRKSVPTALEAWGEFRGFRISYWGLFGVVNVLLNPEWVYPLLEGLLLFGVVGALIAIVRRIRARRRPEGLSSWLLAAVWVAVVAMSLLRWTSMTKASQGRLVFPAIAAISSAAAYGFCTWFRREHEVVACGALALALGTLAVATPWASIQPAYARPELIIESKIPSTACAYGVRYGQGIELVATDVGDVGYESEVFGLPVTLYWRCLASVDGDYSLYVHLFDADGSKLGQRDSYTGGGMYPTSQWSEGEMIADRYWVPIRRLPASPVAAEIEVGLYDIRTMHKVPAKDPQGQAVGRPIIGRVRVPVATESAAPTHAVEARFEALSLYGYDLDASVTADSEAMLSQYWQVTAETSDDWSVFVHLLDSYGEIVSQADGPPMGDAYPSSYWQAEEWLSDQRLLPIPANASGETLTVVTGFYDPKSGRRMAILDGSGAAVGDSVTLCQITVAP